MGMGHIQLRRHKMKEQQERKAQEDSSFPADGHQAILNIA